MKVKTCNDDDNVLIAWKPDGMIPNCRGFAMLRRRNAVEEVVSTFVGFEGQDHEEASGGLPPIADPKYQWTDCMATPGDTLQYRLLPMVGPDKDNLRPAAEAASDCYR
jgi:hypothetical protein